MAAKIMAENTLRFFIENIYRLMEQTQLNGLCFVEIEMKDVLPEVKQKIEKIFTNKGYFVETKFVVDGYNHLSFGYNQKTKPILRISWETETIKHLKEETSKK